MGKIAKRNTTFILKCKRLLSGGLFLAGMVLMMTMITSCGGQNPQESGQAKEPGANTESEGNVPGTNGEYSRESGADPDDGEGAGDGSIAVADVCYMPLDTKDLRNITYTMDGEWLYYVQHVDTTDEEEGLTSTYVYISRGRISDGWHEKDYIVQPKGMAYIRLHALMADGQGNCYVYWGPGYLTEEEDRFYSLEKYGSDGELLWKVDYRAEELSGMGEALDQGTVTADGRVFLYSTGKDGGIFSFGTDGSLEEAYTLPGLETLDGVVSGKDGKVYGYCITGENPAFAELGGSAEQYPCPDGILDVYDGRGSDPCVGMENSIWSYEPETGELGRLWGWGDEYIQIAEEDVDAFFRNGEDFMVMCSEYRSKYAGAWDLDRRPVQTFAAIALEDREKYPPRQRITLGTVESDGAREQFGKLNLVVRMYNRQSREYSVEFLEEEDTDSMQMKFIQGKCADIIDLTYIYAGNLAGIGAFEDLTAYYEASDTVKMEDILNPVREACALAGKNVLVMPSFNILTLVSLEEEVTAEDWDVWEFLERAENEWLVLRQDPMEALMYCMGIRCGEYFIDYEKKECNFDSPEFREILKACRRVKEGADSTNSDNYCIFNLCRIESPWDVTKRSMYGLDLWDYADRIVGYPGMHGSEHKFYPDSVFAMNSASENKDGAWDFLEFMMSEEIQSLTSWGLPSRKDVFEQSMSNIYVSPNRANSFPLYDENGQLIVDEMTKEVTAHEIEVLRGIVENAKYDSWGGSVSPLWRIVSNEAEMYFKGDAGLDSTINKIQNRVQLYLDESK